MFRRWVVIRLFFRLFFNKKQNKHTQAHTKHTQAPRAPGPGPPASRPSPAGSPAEPCRALSEGMAGHGWAGPGARPSPAKPLQRAWQGMVGLGREPGRAPFRGHGWAWQGMVGPGGAKGAKGPGPRPGGSGARVINASSVRRIAFV